VDKNLEGWFSDPYAIHEARWMSQGTPTPLVRDGTVEGHDPAPDGPFTVEPVRLGEDNSEDWGADLRRADDGGRDSEFDPREAGDAAFEAFEQNQQN
jgi:hypothetical protein